MAAMTEPALEVEARLRQLFSQRFVVDLGQVGVRLGVRADLPPGLVELADLVP